MPLFTPEGVDTMNQIEATRHLQSRIAKRGRDIARAELEISGLKGAQCACRVFGQTDDAKQVGKVIFQGRKLIKAAGIDQQIDRRLFRALCNANYVGVTIF